MIVQTRLSAIVGFIVLLLTWWCAPASADCGGETRAATKAGRLAQIVCRDQVAGGLQSVIFGAWSGERPILTTALGYSVSGVPAATSMHFRAGIMQTEALATILLLLVDKGKVSLDDPIAHWLPNLPRAREVTLGMLANSRSGYGDYLTDKHVTSVFERNPFQGFSADQLIGYAMAQPMAFKPGSGFHYAHTNLVILGTALQRITGLSVAQLMAERIIGPLHLHDTRIPVGADIQQPVQHAFSLDRGLYEESTYFDPSWALYSGTITSNIHDVALFQRALGMGVLLSKGAFALQLAPTNVGSGPMTKNLYYGLGVIVADTWILQHARVSGYDVVMAYLPSRDLTIVVSSALGPKSTAKAGYSGSIFKDAAKFLAPERPIPSLFT